MYKTYTILQLAMYVYYQSAITVSQAVHCYTSIHIHLGLAHCCERLPMCHHLPCHSSLHILHGHKGRAKCQHTVLHTRQLLGKKYTHKADSSIATLLSSLTQYSSALSMISFISKCFLALKHRSLCRSSPFSSQGERIF